MPSTHFILIRHGQTDWNLQLRWQGQHDIPLNAMGRQQAQEMVGAIDGRKIDALYSSDLLRARETANALANEHHLEVNLDRRLREISLGKMEGMYLHEIQEQYPEFLEWRARDPWSIGPPGGELAVEVQARAMQFLRETTQKHPGQTVAVVSHGFTLAMILVTCLGLQLSKLWEVEPKNCGFREIDFEI